MTELEPSGVGERPPPYMIFLVVFLFFLTGLLGFLICHLLKKKGYRCRTGDMDDEEEEEEEEKIRGSADDEDEENQDTVEQILKCIIENEANMEAFNEMLGNHNICARHDPRLRKESIGGVPPHLHTVHSGTDLNSCHLCAQVRSKKGRRQSRTPRFKQRPGEQTVFSVGRFRVTHTDKKLHGGLNPLASSGEQLDQDRSQDSEDRKEGGYNLRSMFKDTRPSSESTNGVAPNVGKRRKSVTIFGLRRGSDPVGIKGVETGGVKLAISQQPVVMEEPVQADNTETIHRLGSKPETKPLQNYLPTPPQHGAKTSSPANSSSSQSEKQARDSASEDGFKHGPSPEPRTNQTIKAYTGSMATSAPSSLLIPDAKNKAFQNEEAFNPGPLQTSTPIVSMPGFIPIIPTPQHESHSGTYFPVTQTPPDLSSSQDLEPGLGGNLALISLGSSPPSSFPIKSPSSASSLKTPVSPLTATPSPRLSSTNTPVEGAKTAFPPALSQMSGQSPISSSIFGKSVSPLQAQNTSPNVTLCSSPKLDTWPGLSQTLSSSPADPNPSFRSSPQVTLEPGSPSSLSLKEKELEVRIPNTEQKAEMKRAGILKTAKLSPLEGDLKGFALPFLSYGVSTDRLSSLPLSPSSPRSPSSPLGSRISSVTIVKASPDSKREFSVVTMVEDEECSGGQISDLVAESDETGLSPAVGRGGDISAVGAAQPESQGEETSGAEASLSLDHEKFDIMEMEDIRDCKVMQLQDSERPEQEVEKTEQSKQD